MSIENNSDRISVVVITHNNARHVDRCLESILSQTLRPFEVIVCDDASTDDTCAILDAWAGRYPDIIRLVKHSLNQGIPANLNSGFRIARGDYISLIAGDDIWLPEKLEKEYLRLRETGAAWVYSKVVLYWDDLDNPSQTADFWGTAPGFEGNVFEKVLRREMSLRNYLVRREAMEALGFFDENIGMYEDWDFNIRMSHAYPIAHVPDANVVYLIHGGGEHRAPMYRHMAEVGKILRKNADLMPGRMAEVGRETIQRFWPEQSMHSERDKAAYRTTLDSLELPWTPARVKPDGEGMVFLVSLQRSGSTMLQRILGSHPDIHTTAEPWVMLHPFYQLKGEGVATEYNAQFARQAVVEFLDQLPGGEENYYDAVRQMANVMYSRAVRFSGKSRFLDKTPRYFRILPELIRTFPRAKFVVLLRNPLAVLASVLDTWFGGDAASFEQSEHGRDLLEGPGLLARAIREFGDRIHVTRYEDLVTDSWAEVQRICDYLGLPPYRPMLDYGDIPAPEGNFGDALRVHRHKAPVDDYRDKWVSTLEGFGLMDYARRYAESVGMRVFSELGYTLQSGGVDGLSVAPAPAMNSASLNAEGEQAFADGDLERAERLFRQACEQDSGNVDARNNLMVLNWQRRDMDQAVRYLLESLEIDPLNRDVVINGVQVLATINQPAEALAIGRRYLARNPDDEVVGELCAAVEAPPEAGDEAGEHDGASPVVNDNGDESIGYIDFTRREYSDSAPRISVVVPSYNQGRFLEITLRSIIDQGYPNLELIVVDGGSDDGSVEIIKRYSDYISWWRSHPDDGQYAAIDEGFRRSTGEIMTWINSDDKLHPDCLNVIASVFVQRADVEWVMGTPNIMDEHGHVRWVSNPAPVFSQQNYLNKKYDSPCYIQQEGSFWRRSLWDKAGGRLAAGMKMAGDLELWTRFFRHAPLHTLSVCTGCFRQHGDQKTSRALELYRQEAEQVLDAEIARFAESGDVPIPPVPVLKVRMPIRSAGAGRFADDPELSGRPREEEPDYLVTAIVSTYNSEKYIRGCLEDLVAQTLSERLEIIVVDSASPQGEGAIVEEFQQRYPNIRYIRTDRRETIYAAWNRAARMARGKYLTNANTDDRHRPDAFERMVRELEARPDVALVYADSAVTRQENADFSDAPVNACLRWPDFDARLLFSVCYIGPHPMWRKALHERYGYFDADMKVAGDYDFWLRLVRQETFLHIPEVLGLYLASPDSVEHRHAGEGVRETVAARQRNWPAEWGEMPPPRAGYLVALDGELPREAATDASGPEVPAAPEEPVVSIIMPTRDRLHLLGRAIDSVVAQSFGSWELIVVNDGGESIQPLLEGRDAQGRIRCIEFGWSRGQAAARNTALAEARGEFICYLDDDDSYLPHHLQTVVEALRHGTHDFVYTDAVIVKETLDGGELREQGRATPYQHGDYSHERLLVGNYIPINTWAHRRDLIDAAGMFDASLKCYEDWELLLRFAARKDFLHLHETTVEVHHRVDRVDNVSRQQHGRTVAAYREIYARHREGVSRQMQAERDKVLEHLASRIAEESGGGNEVAPVPEPVVARQPAAGARPLPAEQNAYESWLQERREAAGSREQALERVGSEWLACPAVHFIVVLHPGQETALADTLDSLSGQWYPGWGLSVIASTPCPDRLFDELDNLEWCQVDGEPDEALARMIRDSGADWLALLDAGVILEPHFLYACLDDVRGLEAVRLVYTDEGSVDAHGVPVEPRFKPDFNLEFLRSTPYIGPLVMVRREMLDAADGLAADPAVAAYDLAFRVAERFGDTGIHHVAQVLYHRPAGQAGGPHREMREARQRACLEAHLQRAGVSARVSPAAVEDGFHVEYACDGGARVDILVPVSGRPELLGLFLDNLLGKTGYPNFRVRLVLADQVDPGRALENRKDVELVRCGKGERPWSRVLELACSSPAEHVLFMAPSALVVQPNWLERLVGFMQRPEVSAVAPRLISTDKKVVDGPIVLGAGGCAVGAIVHSGLALDDPGYMGRAQLAQEVSAVSTNCMLVRRKALAALDVRPDGYRIPLYQAVDFCLKLGAQGGKIVSTPQVTLLHAGEDSEAFSGIDVGKTVLRESSALCRKDLPALANDPAYNPNLKLVGKFFALDDEFSPAWSRTATRQLRCLGFGVGTFGAWEFRVRQPLSAMHEAGVASTVVLPYAKSIVRLPTVTELARMEPDVVLMHNAIHDEYIDAMAAWARNGKVDIVFGQDDLMFALPPKNPFSKTVYKDARRRIRRCLDIADRVVVSTEPLAEALADMAADIRVVPNHLDESVWGELRSQPGQSGRPRVGWAGAQQHLGDLELLEAVVRETCDQVDWIFFGMCPDFLRPYVREYHDPVSFLDYPGKLASLNLDVAVAPLELNRFNECKSNLRILEYGALAWPVVASDIAPYRNAPLCRVHNQPRAWINAILERAHDPEAARTEGEQLRDWVRSNGFLRRHLDLWADALSGEPVAADCRSVGNATA